MKKIGIIGGMGPEAAVSLQWMMLREAQHLGACGDASVPPMLVDQNTGIPNRTEAILRHGASPLPQLQTSLRLLEHAECDFAVMPCVTAHHWLPELQHSARIPVLDMVGLTLERMRRMYGYISKWLLLATEGTLKSGLFPQRMGTHQSIVSPAIGSAEQQQVMEAIYHPRHGIKAGGVLMEDEYLREDYGVSPTALLHKVIDYYRVMHGCEGVILGCTELPLAVDRVALERSGMVVVDPMEVIARVATEAAMNVRNLPRIANHRVKLTVIEGANDA